jgi:small subunit ribosomal protein S1
VVAFGAFVEIVPGVEGLVHISELAEHHVENPSEVVAPGQEVWVRILEIDEERRRISLSVKRAEGQNLPLRDLMPPELRGEAPAATEEVPDLDLSEEVFSESPPEAPQDEAAEPAAAEPAEADVPEPAAPEAAEAPQEEPAEAAADEAAEAPAEEPTAPEAEASQGTEAAPEPEA